MHKMAGNHPYKLSELKSSELILTIEFLTGYTEDLPCKT